MKKNECFKVSLQQHLVDVRGTTALEPQFVKRVHVYLFTSCSSPDRRCTAAGAQTCGRRESAGTSRTAAPCWGWAPTRRSGAPAVAGAACPRLLCRWRRTWRSRSSGPFPCSGRRSLGGFGRAARCSSWRPRGSRWLSSRHSEPSGRHARSSGSPAEEKRYRTMSTNSRTTNTESNWH